MKTRLNEEIRYTAPVNGEVREESFTTQDVSDDRAAWDPDVALAYARHLAVDEFGFENIDDVNAVEIQQMGEPHANFDETGSTGGSL